MKNDIFDAVYADGLAGYEVGLIECGERAIWRYCPPGQPPKKPHKSKIYLTAKGRAYFLANGHRIHLDECLRKDIGPAGHNRP